ncbi:GNAT family N-acetyltransferase [Neobacillus sp. Marseille-QA0830]
MEIIRLTRSEQKNILSLFNKTTKALKKNGVDQWDIFYPNRFVVRKDLKQQNIFGIIMDGRVIAVVTFDMNQSQKKENIPWQNHHENACWIHRLAVDPDFQGRGLGKQLLQFAEQQAIDKGCTCIRLEVYSANPAAVSLYQKAGYQERGEVTFPFRKEPYLCFEKSLVHSN